MHAAWVKHDVAQCGYCQSGQIMSATAFLKSLPARQAADRRRDRPAMDGNICRCGTYARIRAAVADAATRARLKEPPCCTTSTTANCRVPLQRLLARRQNDAASTLPRRSFLKLAGASGLALGAFPHLAMARLPRQAASALKPTQQPSAFVQIARNGEVTVTINRLEFGQGVNTALPMILAEELDADWSLVRSRHGTNDAAYADPLFGIHLTGGSHTIKNSFTQYRELGARARAMLLGAAAARWKVDVATLRTQAGTVLGPGGRKLGYGELAEAAMALPVPEKVTLKDPKDFRIIGRPTPRLDARGQEQRAAGLRHRRSPARSADGRGRSPAGVRRAPGRRWTTARRVP